MTNRYVIDAHTIIWHLEDNPRLGTHAGAVMDDPGSRLLLPIISLAEACWIVEHGRSPIPTVAQLIADIDADPRIEIVPLTREILELSVSLQSVGEMHDRLIVATGISILNGGESVSILTKDENIRASGLLPVVW